MSDSCTMAQSATSRTGQRHPFLMLFSCLCAKGIESCIFYVYNKKEDRGSHREKNESTISKSTEPHQHQNL